MTEKKYMTASKYFIEKRIKNQMWYDEYKADISAIESLDDRFIDKEELKEKINDKLWNYESKLKVYNNDYNYSKAHMIKQMTERIKIFKEILKLLDEQK